MGSPSHEILGGTSSSISHETDGVGMDGVPAAADFADAGILILKVKVKASCLTNTKISNHQSLLYSMLTVAL